MAYITTHSSNHLPGRGLRQGIANFFTGLQRGLAARREYERLAAMSDDALARHGLTRRDIPAEVAKAMG